jgi:hypothetical protein
MEMSYRFATNLFGGAKEVWGERNLVKMVSLQQLSGQHSKVGTQNSDFVGKVPDFDNARVTVEQAVWMSSSHQHPGGSNYSISPRAVDGRREGTSTPSENSRFVC